jgi:hypothetical protein
MDVESASTPVCWLCRGPIVDQAVWRHVERKGHPLYRPSCPDCRSDAWFCEKACAQRARRHTPRVGLDELAPDRQRRSGPVAAYIPGDE